MVHFRSSNVATASSRRVASDPVDERRLLDARSPSKAPIDFAVSSKVIYPQPAPGAAIVTSRSVRKVDGEKITYLELSVAAGESRRRGGALKVSESTTAPRTSACARPSSDEVEDVLAYGRHQRAGATNWSRR